MNHELQVHLSKIKIFGYHGVHPEEQILGGDFEVTVTVSCKPAVTIVQQLEHTVDYTQLFALVKNRMQRPTPLLETLATEIAGEIFAKFPLVSGLAISIFKLHAPIENLEGSVGVTYKTTRV